MGRLTTHVLDTAKGRPGRGIRIDVHELVGSEFHLIKSMQTNADGRTDGPLLEGASLRAGTYQLVFHIGPYFAGEGFLDLVPVRFTVGDAAAHYHVPLLCSPWSYSTYRGS